MKSFLNSYLLEFRFAADKMISFFLDFTFLSFDYSDEEKEIDFFWDQGPRCCVVASDGRIPWISGQKTISYRLDKNGNVISRMKMIDSLKEGERLIVGDKAVERAYLASPDKEDATHEISPRSMRHSHT